MCTVSIKVDENVIREVLPELDNTAAISRWAQMLVDQYIADMKQGIAPEELYNGLKPGFIDELDDDETMDLETARAMLHQTIREEYARP